MNSFVFAMDDESGEHNAIMRVDAPLVIHDAVGSGV